MPWPLLQTPLPQIRNVPSRGFTQLALRKGQGDTFLLQMPWGAPGTCLEQSSCHVGAQEVDTLGVWGGLEVWATPVMLRGRF